MKDLIVSEQLSRFQDSIVAAVDDWLRWLPRWAPSTSRGRARICRRCVGSPLVSSAGLVSGIPHQVVHALNVRVQRIIDAEVDRFTSEQLPFLCAELATEELWRSGGAQNDPGLPPELDGLDIDPEPEGDQPYLFTFADLAQAVPEVQQLPLPPLSEAEKVQLRSEIAQADAQANSLGREACFVLLQNQLRIQAGIARFVEPQIQLLLDQLVDQLDAPREL